ncbi:helix-turn-helix domain-containing protein [Acholeplasma laidlawii]|uniref:helix-turn-helix domain-containing protein n=1 Tax=Acholeplasma laidlawii TaxID=2148 RepID=UPI00253FA93D|nr:helix-turn-helix transcriptional regulator [Acholeplasma laidlawii]
MTNIRTLFICENLKRLRTSHKLSYTKVAAVLNKTRQAYVNYEKGIRHITITDLMMLAEFYNISLDTLTGNPYQTKSLNELTFATYELTDNEIVKTSPTTISTILDDILILRQSNYHSDFFLKSNTYHKNEVMLFEYLDKIYQSKVYYQKDGSGFFFINGDAIPFTKGQAENIYYLGIQISTLTKVFNVNNSF